MNDLSTTITRCHARDPRDLALYSRDVNTVVNSIQHMSLSEQRRHSMSSMASSGSICPSVLSSTGSTGSIRGWGSSSSRTSYKIGLSDLAENPSKGGTTESTIKAQTEIDLSLGDAWGYYIDTSQSP